MQLLSVKKTFLKKLTYKFIFLGIWCFQALRYMKKVYYEYKDKWFEKMGVKNLKELKDKYLTKKSLNSLRTKKILISSQVSQSNSLMQGSINSLVIVNSRSELNGVNGNKNK